MQRAQGWGTRWMAMDKEKISRRDQDDIDQASFLHTFLMKFQFRHSGLLGSGLSQSMSQPLTHSLGLSINPSVGRPLGRPLGRSDLRSVSQLLGRSVSQSLIQLGEKYWKLFWSVSSAICVISPTHFHTFCTC